VDNAETLGHVQGGKRKKAARKKTAYSGPAHNSLAGASSLATETVLSQRKENPLSCPVCGVTLSSERNLRRHMELHGRKRPFSCSFCGNSYTSSHHLKRHELIHTSEQPYQCPTCLKRFGRKDHCHKHIRKVHP